MKESVSAACGMKGVPAFYLAIGSKSPSGHFRNSLGYESLRQNAYSCQQKRSGQSSVESKKWIELVET